MEGLLSQGDLSGYAYCTTVSGSYEAVFEAAFLYEKFVSFTRGNLETQGKASLPLILKISKRLSKFSV